MEEISNLESLAARIDNYIATHKRFPKLEEIIDVNRIFEEKIFPRDTYKIKACLFLATDDVNQLYYMI